MIIEKLKCQCNRCGRFTDREHYVPVKDGVLQLCENCAWEHSFFDKLYLITIEKGNKKLILIC